MVTQNHPIALDRSGPLSTLKAHNSDDHTVGKNYIVSGTNDGKLSGSNKVKCFNSINAMNMTVQICY
jgi:hypothetical protein